MKSLALLALALACASPTAAQLPGPTYPSHVPAGYRMAVTASCARIPEAGFVVQNPANFGLATDAERGSVCQTRYPAGWHAASAPATYYVLLPKPKPRDLFVSYWTKTSAAWTGCNVGYKQLIAKAANGTQAYPRLIGYGSLAGVTVENPTLFPKGLGNQALPSASYVVGRDVWHFHELHLTGGRVRYWVDGHLVTDADVRGFVPTTWTEVQWRPIYGGGCARAVPATQYEWLDDLTVWVP